MWIFYDSVWRVPRDGPAGHDQPVINVDQSWATIITQICFQCSDLGINHRCLKRIGFHSVSNKTSGKFVWYSFRLRFIFIKNLCQFYGGYAYLNIKRFDILKNLQDPHGGCGRLQDLLVVQNTPIYRESPSHVCYSVTVYVHTVYVESL